MEDPYTIFVHVGSRCPANPGQIWWWNLLPGQLLVVCPFLREPLDLGWVLHISGLPDGNPI